MFEWLKNIVGVQPFVAPQDAPMVADQAAAPQGVLAAGNAAMPVAANDENYSLTEQVNKALSEALRKQTIQKYGPNGSTRPAAFPLKDVSLISLDGYDNPPHLSARIGNDEEADARPHGERVCLKATLAGPLEDYNVPQLEAAMVTLVSAIPMFKGKVVAKPIAPKAATYKEVGAGLEAILDAHPDAFPPEDRAKLKQFFATTPNKLDVAPADRWDSMTGVSHFEGKVQVRIGGYEAPSTKKETPVESSDVVIVNYFKAHRKQLLEKMKAKVIALRKADGTPVVTEAELANLELHATANYRIELLFGNKPANAIDPATNQKLVGEARAKQFTETPLTKVDTDKLAEIFNESLVEVSKPLPPMLEKFADGHMLAQILRQRIPNNPELEAFLAKHDMFLTAAEKRAKEPKAVSPDQIVLDEPYAQAEDKYAGADGKRPHISLSFNLPEKMTLHQLYEHIAANRNQMGVGVQQLAANEPSVTGGIAA